MPPEIVILAPFAALVVASAFDLRTREIPDWIPLSILATGALAIATGLWPLSWAQGAIGVALGLIVALVAGLVLKFGGGDAKLIVALGIWLGPVGLLMTLGWTALFGAALALIAKARGAKDYAYAPAIAAGLAFQATCSYILPRLF